MGYKFLQTLTDKSLTISHHDIMDKLLMLLLSSVLCPLQHSIGYMGNGFLQVKDPTNRLKVLKENLQRKKTQTTQRT